MPAEICPHWIKNRLAFDGLFLFSPVFIEILDAGPEYLKACGLSDALVEILKASESVGFRLCRQCINALPEAICPVSVKTRLIYAGLHLYTAGLGFTGDGDIKWFLLQVRNEVRERLMEGRMKKPFLLSLLEEQALQFARDQGLFRESVSFGMAQEILTKKFTPDPKS
ncbi:MAG: hypothetical protein VYA01_04990, partial [Bacteroidota bacterium]|nr:hypothetical protein [Bacteroidota bacterium]